MKNTVLNTVNNLSFDTINNKKESWFILYKNFIYGNKITSINQKINNKVIIDKIHIQGNYKKNKIIKHHEKYSIKHGKRFVFS